MQPILEGDFASTVLWFGSGAAEMSADFDGDGVDEDVILCRDTPNGTRFFIVKGTEGVSLECPQDGFDGLGNLKPEYHCQLAVADVTNDGYPEILFAVSDNAASGRLDVWRFDGDRWATTHGRESVNPFTRIAEISGQSKFLVLAGGRIDVLIGSQGFFERFAWDGTQFVNRGSPDLGG